MKVLPIIANINKNIKNRSKELSQAGKNGYNIAKRTSQIYNQGCGRKYYNVSKSVSKQLYKEFSIDDLPLFAGAIGMFVPLPLVSPAMFMAGKIVQIAVNFSRGKCKTKSFQDINFHDKN